MMKNRPKLNKLNRKRLKMFGIIVLILVLPLTLILMRTVQDQRSSAAAPDKLETEGGVLSSSGVSKQSNGNASGGQFVLFNRYLGPTPTSSPNPSMPPGAIYVPDSIDFTGNRDVSSEINSFIANSPDGSTIVFKQGAIYNLGERILINRRNNITLEGNGATLKLTGTGTQISGAIIIENQSNGITVQNFVINGNYTLAGTTQSCCSREGNHAIQIYGSDNTYIETVDIDRIGGDCFYMEPSPADRWPNGVTIRNSGCELAGRHGVMIEGGRNIVVENNRFDKLGMYFVDFEPGQTLYGADGVIIRNNTVGSYGHTGQYDCWFIAILDAPWNNGGSTVKNVTIDNNTTTCGISGWHGGVLGLQMFVNGNQFSNTVRENIIFTNNKATCTVDGSYFGVLRFFSVNGLTVTGNVQPHTGLFANFTGSSNITSDVPY